jgi:hypothetical protein
VEVQLHAFFTSALHGGERSVSRFTPRERAPGTHVQKYLHFNTDIKVLIPSINITTAITKFQALQPEDQELLNLLQITVRKLLERNALLPTFITCHIITRAEQRLFINAFPVLYLSTTP